MAHMAILTGAPSIPMPLYKISRETPGTNKPAIAKNKIPLRFTSFGCIRKRDRIQNVTVPIKVTITEAERKLDFTNSILIRTIPNPKMEAPKRASDSESNTIHSHYLEA